MSTPRVVSLVPSATEILRHLGVEPVGISHCCENRDTGAVVLTSSIIPDGLSQGEIDRFVSAASAKGESLYRVNEALLDRLRPDLILTQGVCDVCAVGTEEVARANACLARETPTVFLNGTTLEDLFTDIAIVGDSIGRDVTSEIAALRARVEAVREAVAGRPTPRVAFVEWLDPPFLGGHWVPDMIAAAGAVAIGPASGVPSPRSTWAEIASEHPDVLLFSFCGYSLPATLADLAALPDLAANALSSVTNHYALDAQYYCQLTPKAVRGIEILAGLLHPDVWPAPAALEAASTHG